MNRSLTFFSVLILVLFLSGCSLADLRNNYVQESISQTNAKKGKDLLHAAWKAQGMDKLRSHQVYQLEGEDHWKGAMGKLSTLWPEARIDLRFRYAINTFDSQIEFLSGERLGTKIGLQSWQYYEQEPDAEPTFEVATNAKHRFGLAAIQYFFELADRLRDAPIISFAGSREAFDNTYDLVFVTWESVEPHQQHDQYRLWINQATKRMEVAEYTIRDAPQKLPGSQAFYGSIRFEDFREVEGMMIPFQQYVFLNAPKKDLEQYIHKLTFSKVEFDTFDLSELYPNPDLEKLGDDKMVTTE